MGNPAVINSYIASKNKRRSRETLPPCSCVYVFIIFAIPLIALGIGMIFTLKSRIDEIRSGEEDDLGNY